ncbi:MAG: hypothetical protein IOD12_16960 [Silvanigrellales bacterium]|nr:hypothetical protein [Silvanigrellales bacterium]
MKSLVVLALALPAAALANTTGPGAVMFRLDDRWVSIPPSAQQLVTEAPKVASTEGTVVEATPAVEVAPAVVAPEAAPAASIPGYNPDANYSGACHITVDLAGKTYVINETSNTAMVNETPEGKVCLPSESLARDYGFSKVAR